MYVLHFPSLLRTRPPPLPKSHCHIFLGWPYEKTSTDRLLFQWIFSFQVSSPETISEVGNPKRFFGVFCFLPEIPFKPFSEGDLLNDRHVSPARPPTPTSPPSRSMSPRSLGFPPCKKVVNVFPSAKQVFFLSPALDVFSQGGRSLIALRFQLSFSPFFFRVVRGIGKRPILS